MKTFQLRFKTLLFFLLTGFIFASCSKDDTSVKNQAPNSFNLIEVADGATDVGLQPQLTWEAATDPDGDKVTYLVYLDTQNPPQTPIVSNLGVNTFSLEDKLQSEKIHYWMVIAKDVNGNTTESDIASFTSRDMTNAEAIVGKWFWESIEGEPPLTACEKKNFFQFTENLSIQSKNYYEDSNGDCVVDDAEIDTYKFIENDQIEVSGGDGPDTWKIQSLTKTKLELDAYGAVLTLTKE